MVGPEGRVVRRGARRRYLTSHEASRPSLKSIHGDRRSTWGLCCEKLSPFHGQERKSAKGDLLSGFVLSRGARSLNSGDPLSLGANLRVRALLRG